MPELSAVGIDLGTTYSSIAIVNSHGEAEIIPNAESDRLTPSAVFFDSQNIIVGQIAKDAAISNPDQVVLFIKRQMGNPNWTWKHNTGQVLKPEDISAFILAKLKKDAESYLNRRLPYAVITVPAYFDDVRRRATIAAGEIAGLKVMDILNEPTAAAIAFGVERSRGNETILVYDLGGGTFDVTIMRIENESFQVIASDGDHQLGGKDFEDSLMRFAVEHFVHEHRFDPTTDAIVAGELRTYAEKAKRELSKLEKTTIVVRARDKTSRIEVTRSQYESLIKPKLDTTLSLVKSVLSDAKLVPNQIDRVLLIGGSTRTPAVRKLLRSFFSKDPDTSVNPDEAVALGAALMAAKKIVDLSPNSVPEPIVETVTDLEVTEVTSHSLGIGAVVPGTQQRINSILIPRQTPIPSQISKEFITTTPGATAISVTVYQGEFQDPTLCNPIGEFKLTGLPPNRPAGKKVRVTISYDAKGIIHVTALDIETGKEMTTQVSYKIGTSTDEQSAKQMWLNTLQVQ